MIRKISIVCASLLLGACGGGSNASAGSQILVQELASSNGVPAKYAGSWSSCTAQANGQFIRNNISFSLSGTDLLFTPSIGIVGAFSDAACTLPVPGQSAGVTPIVPLRISLIKVINIAQQSNFRFSGNADELPDIGQPDFKFAGFNSSNTSIWFSSTSTFSGGVIRYDKN